MRDPILRPRPIGAEEPAMLVEHFERGKGGNTQPLSKRYMLHGVLRTEQNCLVGVVDFRMGLFGCCRRSHVEAFCEFDVWAAGGVEIDYWLAVRDNNGDQEVNGVKMDYSSAVAG